jgi:hypothetical protein
VELAVSLLIKSELGMKIGSENAKATLVSEGISKEL